MEALSRCSSATRWTDQHETQGIAALGSKRNRKRRHAERELRRDEVIVPETHAGVLGEWARDQSYAYYVALHRTGWVGKVIATLAVLGIVIGLLLGALQSF